MNYFIEILYNSLMHDYKERTYEKIILIYFDYNYFYKLYEQ